MDKSDDLEVYRFWIHFFTSDELKRMLETKGFEDIDCYDKVLLEINLWNGNNALFCKVRKIVGEIG